MIIMVSGMGYWDTESKSYYTSDDPVVVRWEFEDTETLSFDSEFDLDLYLRDVGLRDRSPLPLRDIPTKKWVDRFTDAELASIRSTSSVLIDRALSAVEIDVLDPVVIAGIDMLISAGVIDASRKSEILSRGL